ATPASSRSWTISSSWPFPHSSRNNEIRPKELQTACRRFRSRDSTSHKCGQICGIVAADREAAAAQGNDHAITTPKVPHPTAARTQVDATTLDDRRPPHLDARDVVVSHRPPEQRQRPKGDQQSIAGVFD